MTSQQVYAALLNLYPSSFRREYGDEMVQVFVDCQRRARRQRGRIGAVSVWLVVVCDLAISVCKEHIREVIEMSRSRVIQFGGIAAMVGGILFFFGFLLHPTGAARAIVPGSILLLFVGVAGLNVALSGRQRRLGRVAFALAAVGLALGFVGMLGSWLGILSPNPLARVINAGEHSGLVFIGASLVAWGVVAIRSQLLGPFSFAPLLVGLASLAGITFIVPSAFTALENSAFPLLYAGFWVLLGFGLLTASGNSRQPVKT